MMSKERNKRHHHRPCFGVDIGKEREGVPVLIPSFVDRVK
jgi:hypothetical protein